MDGESGDKYIAMRAKRWPWQVNVVTNLDQAGARDYLSQQGRVAVMPSLVENSPYTVLECLGVGIPFLASRVGGISELVHADDVDAVCFRLDARELVQRFKEVLRKGARRARPAQEFDDCERQWLAWHATLAAPSARMPVQAVERTQLPKVSVCMAHFNRPETLRQALDSLSGQDYANFEVVLVDDGSTDPEAIGFLDALEPQFAERGWRLVRQQNRYLGAARNTAADSASGEYLLFMDDDNIAKPNEISTFVQAALQSGADILTCLMDVFEGDQPPGHGGKLQHRALWLGAAPAVGMLRNCYGDANALVRRDSFIALGGFTEDYGVGHEDWELFARAVLAGYRLEVVPEALFWYRVTEGSMLRSGSDYKNNMRHLRPYLDQIDPVLHGMVFLAHGQQKSNQMPAEAQTSKEVLEIKALIRAARVVAGRGDVDGAMAVSGEAMALAQKLDDPSHVLEVMLNTGKLLAELSRYEAASAIVGDALGLAQQLRHTDAAEKAGALMAAVTQARHGASMAVSR
jgi:glycosyltransferase involved in cell wall biosynthesis